ncbi:MAG: hypothetical protein NC084_08920 [Bacteroides sp.]|nr:hypothetical protein [Eubacterium sp.]MCM1418336.1 hypothetical protein [Roseburia sp.]MCM1462818.1 hypothetical protein [Bacteroides sp.]
MIIDPKLERMFHQCHEHKQQLDKKRAAIRAVMFCPPALIAAGIFLSMVMQFFKGLIWMAAQADSEPSVPILAFFAAILLGVFIAGETMIENNALIENSTKFYTGAAVASTGAAALSFASGGSSGALLLSLALLCVVDLPLDLVFKRLHAENEMLKPLKGYPHFNPLLMSDAELREAVTPDRKPLDELSPDERLMRERDMNL